MLICCTVEIVLRSFEITHFVICRRYEMLTVCFILISVLTSLIQKLFFCTNFDLIWRSNYDLGVF